MIRTDVPRPFLSLLLALTFLLSALLTALPTMADHHETHAEDADPEAHLESHHVDGAFDFEHLAALRTVREVAISPAGDHVAYVLEVQRIPGVDEDGPAWRHLYVLDLSDGVDDAAASAEARPYVTGDVTVNDVAFTPDGSLITYRSKRASQDDDEETALWALPVDGGESRVLLRHETGVGDYAVSPDGSRVAYLAEEAESEAEKEAEEEGYDAEIFEEEWRHVGLWIADLPGFVESPADPKAANDETEKTEDAEPRRIAVDQTFSQPRWSPDGTKILTAVQPRNLIDDRYMKRRVRIFDAGTGETVAAVENPGKLGDYRFSPDGARVAMISAADPHDTKEGRLMVALARGESPGLRDLMPDVQAHVKDFRWLGDDTLLYAADVGSETELGTVSLDGEKKVLLRSGDGVGPDAGPIVEQIDAAGCRVVIAGERPVHPREVYLLETCGNGASPVLRARRMTDSNPWLDDVKLAEQEVITWTASDGLEIEGMLLYPLDGEAEDVPLLLMVHGGPESHDSNGWVTSYSRPGQVAAAHGFAVLYPNYRGSTGRGVAFAKTSQGDAAGAEFRDLAEAVDHLVETGLADPDRVGITGGSYGGYATAWCSTRYTDRFAAGVMFVGISNKISKGFTSDIPVEDKMVHTLYDPWENWQLSLERSPLYHAETSETALLIAGGTADTRVHPSQSLQLYRAFQLIGQAPVRYVRYPGEPHGNRRAASRDDYARRLVRWMIHFVKEGRDELPPKELPGTPRAGEESEKESDGEPAEVED